MPAFICNVCVWVCVCMCVCVYLICIYVIYIHIHVHAVLRSLMIIYLNIKEVQTSMLYYNIYCSDSLYRIMNIFKHSCVIFYCLYYLHNITYSLTWSLCIFIIGFKLFIIAQLLIIVIWYTIQPRYNLTYNMIYNSAYV